MISVGGYYRTPDGNIGRLMAAASLNHEFKGVFAFDEQLTLCQLFFDNDKREFWLSNQIEEVENPSIALF